MSASSLGDEVRLRVQAIVNNEFGGDRDAAARVLESETKRSISHRTVQAWLMPPGQRSSRTCPEWALAALQGYLGKPGSDSELAAIRRARGNDRRSSRSRTANAICESAVEQATSQIEHQSAMERAWSSARMQDLPGMLFRFQLEVSSRLDQLENKFDLLATAPVASANFEQFQQQVREGLADIATAKHVIARTLQDIEAPNAEFAHPEGLLPKDLNRK